MSLYQSIQCHTGLTHTFNFFDIRSLSRSGMSARAWMSQIKKGGLDQFGPEHLEV